MLIVIPTLRSEFDIVARVLIICLENTICARLLHTALRIAFCLMREPGIKWESASPRRVRRVAFAEGHNEGHNSMHVQLGIDGGENAH